MTRDEELFEKWYYEDWNACDVESKKDLETTFLAALQIGREEEREACAEVAEKYTSNNDGNADQWTITTTMNGLRIAAALRSRGAKKGE